MEVSPSVGFDALEAFASTDSISIGVFSDLDGTLASIVARPEDARPVEGAVEAIMTLAGAVGRVAIVSGRPVSFLQQFFRAPVELSGLYGIEYSNGEQIDVYPEAQQWLPIIAEVAADAAERFGASVVENKGYSLTVHYRGATEEAAASIEAWSKDVATEHGLHIGSAKMSVELHPPISRDKGDAIADMVDGLSAAVYFGDDLGDRSGFERLLATQSNGELAVVATVLVKGDETPDELLDVSTDVVRTQADVVEMLHRLIDATRK